MSLPHKRIIIVVLAALAVAAYGVGHLAASSEAAPDSDQTTLDSLTTRIVKAGWAKMDHDMSGPGFQMPSAMMPGMPENGDERLGITVTVVNTSGDTRPLRPAEEFALRSAKDGKQWEPSAHTFNDLPRLPPGNAVKGILFFDVKPDALTDSQTWIEWTRGDSTNRLIVPLDGVPSDPGHSH